MTELLVLLYAPLGALVLVYATRTHFLNQALKAAQEARLAAEMRRCDLAQSIRQALTANATMRAK